MASRFFRYVQDTRREMAHVSWPTRMQTISFTIMVIVLSLLVAAYLSVFDSIFTQGLKATLEHTPRFIGITTQSDGDVEVTPIDESDTNGETNVDELEVEATPLINVDGSGPTETQ